ncbi:hypothetical protein MKX01_002829 [Papaver californicum]|nr:hypothetical protein MKX01_002829 [Papaver californicum]
MGQVYCDTCRAGFETEISEPIKVDDDNMYSIAVNSDHEDDVCEVLLKEKVKVVCIKNNNGIESLIRFMNSLVFLKK